MWQRWPKAHLTGTCQDLAQVAWDVSAKLCQASQKRTFEGALDWRMSCNKDGSPKNRVLRACCDGVRVLLATFWIQPQRCCDAPLRFCAKQAVPMGPVAKPAALPVSTRLTCWSGSRDPHAVIMSNIPAEKTHFSIQSPPTTLSRQNNNVAGGDGFQSHQRMFSHASHLWQRLQNFQRAPTTITSISSTAVVASSNSKVR